MTLKIAPCSHDAAKHAVMKWHYSQAMPSGKLIHYGVWEDERFIGAVIYGRGANNNMLTGYGLKMNQGCELVRVALREHKAPVSQIVAETIRLLRNSNPGLRLIVSYADPVQGHHGGIYQAMNWLYSGMNDGSREIVIHGTQQHERSVSAMLRQRKQRKPARPGEGRIEYIRRVIDPNARPVMVPGKHRYLYPLDKAMRRQITKLAQGYPEQHAVEESMVTRFPTGGEMQVQPLPTAQSN